MVQRARLMRDDLSVDELAAPTVLGKREHLVGVMRCATGSAVIVSGLLFVGGHAPSPS
jgi:hypothetical protein